MSGEEVRDELQTLCADVQLDNMGKLDVVSVDNSPMPPPAGDVSIYAVDPLTRRASALQRTAAARTADQ
jgi:hypothetical protein